MRSIELFAGCGGLALGIAEAGFEHELIVERDVHAYATLLLNKERRIKHLKSWQLEQGDVRHINYSTLTNAIDLISGGPPCQPFSLGGKHQGPKDERNMWPEAIRAIKALRPKAFIFENVRGLLRPAFGNYLNFLRLQLSHPDMGAKKEETWEYHLRRLVNHDKRVDDPAYHVLIQGINTADYGAPQKRHRALIIGIRKDVSSDFEFPQPTHSLEKLLWQQYITGEYWERHQVSRSMRPSISHTHKSIIKKLHDTSISPKGKAWLTVRDAVGDLPQPKSTIEIMPHHLLHPGARSYAGHTGSVWDQPAKALKAGAHGVPGGENMLLSKSGAVRYFTIREMARLQGFPDAYLFSGSWASQIRQLGNAVPVQVGCAIGKEIGNLLTCSFSTERKKAA